MPIIILKDNPNNIFFKIKFKSPKDFMNEDLMLLNGIYPKYINQKEDLYKYLNESKIKYLEDKELIIYKWPNNKN